MIAGTQSRGQYICWEFICSWHSLHVTQEDAFLRNANTFFSLWFYLRNSGQTRWVQGLVLKQLLFMRLCEPLIKQGENNLQFKYVIIKFRHLFLLTVKM